MLFPALLLVLHTRNNADDNKLISGIILYGYMLYNTGTVK